MNTNNELNNTILTVAERRILLKNMTSNLKTLKLDKKNNIYNIKKLKNQFRYFNLLHTLLKKYIISENDFQELIILFEISQKEYYKSQMFYKLLKDYCNKNNNFDLLHISDIIINNGLEIMSKNSSKPYKENSLYELITIYLFFKKENK